MCIYNRINNFVQIFEDILINLSLDEGSESLSVKFQPSKNP